MADKLKMSIDEFSFKRGNDYLDVSVETGYLVIKTETSGSFVIDSIKDLDLIHAKLKELLINSKRK